MGARYWDIEQSMLVSMLQRAHDGEDPGMIMLEVEANAAHEDLPES